MTAGNSWLLSVVLLVSVAGCDPAAPPGEPGDDPTTPGDDRPGYFECRTYGSLETVLCGPGTVCCTLDEPVCVEADPGCPNPLQVTRCDGPEDCEYAGEHCITGTHGQYCSSQEGSSTWCHVDADCVDVQPWLPDVPCGANGTCAFAAGSVER